MMRKAHCRFADPLFSALRDVARQPYARAVAGRICIKPYHLPPPPTAVGRKVLSCLASADSNPIQNASRPLASLVV